VSAGGKKGIEKKKKEYKRGRKKPPHGAYAKKKLDGDTRGEGRKSLVSRKERNESGGVKGLLRKRKTMRRDPREKGRSIEGDRPRKKSALIRFRRGADGL